MKNPAPSSSTNVNVGLPLTNPVSRMSGRRFVMKEEPKIVGKMRNLNRVSGIETGAKDLATRTLEAKKIVHQKKPNLESRLTLLRLKRRLKWLQNRTKVNRTRQVMTEENLSVEAEKVI